MSDVDFCLLINMQGFFKLILSFYVCVSGYVQVTQNNKFAISLNYLKKEVSDKLIFCMQVSMKVSYKLILWYWLGWSSILKVSKMASFQRLFNIPNRNLEMKFIFLYVDKHQSLFTNWFQHFGHRSFLLDDTTIGRHDQASKFSAKWCSHYCWAWSSILKVPKVTS